MSADNVLEDHLARLDRARLGGESQEHDKQRIRAELFGADPPPPRRIGRFEIEGSLGHGGMSTVFRAFDPRLNRHVAIKVMDQRLREQHGRRLLIEAQALAKLRHPNVVEVYEVGQDGDRMFIAMELLTGETLEHWQRRPHPWRKCLHVYIQVGRGLAASHDAGIVHRDFKPANCILEGDHARVLDFGLARVLDSADRRSTRQGSASASNVTEVAAVASSISSAGTAAQTSDAVVGTPAYAAPEQWLGQPADHRGDQFSYCVAVYEALYGQRPFVDHARTVVTPTASGIDSPPRNHRPNNVPQRVLRVLRRGLSHRPEDRWPSMHQLLAELERLSTPSAPRWMTAGLVAGLTCTGVGLWRYAEVGFRCDGASEQLAQIWGPDQHRRVRDAILETGLPYAPGTWRHAKDRLDAYAEAWADKHTEICEATAVRQQQSSAVMDLRLGCLRERRQHLQALVSVLDGADSG
ncbi:MAG: serine/threonine protein kinase, partial [Deltaproteobacteria bacterium]|nr:serine/threonine protein kinase [Deltaproteobacteria bacterium]